MESGKSRAERERERESVWAPRGRTRACVPAPCDLCCGRGDMVSATACCAGLEPPPPPLPPPGRSREFGSAPACDCGGVDAVGAIRPVDKHETHAIGAKERI